MSKRALLIGIDYYDNISNLSGCVADIKAITEKLEYNQDGTPNYDCTVFLDRVENGQPITRTNLRKACQKLFSDDFKGDVLFYFSGHGSLTKYGGYLCTSDATQNDWGVPMQEIIDMASKSSANDILILLDCCHSGDIANPAILNTGNHQNPLALIRENMTVIAASRDSQLAMEQDGHGLFTAAVLDALAGGAADHLGWVTASSIYTYVERRFGCWDQRPVYKSHATGVTVVRECAPLIERLKLYDLVKLFRTEDFKYQLDPEFEPEDEHGNVIQPVNKEKVSIAQVLKEYRDAGLVKPSISGEQLYWTARRSHTVELTPRGREYWWLVSNRKV